MKMKFGALVVDGRGKIGGHVASKNRAGAYLRTKVTPVNPQTAAQNLVRSRLTTLSQAWKSLTEAQRQSFNSAVGDYAKSDIFGDVRNPSGANLFQRLNNNLLGVGESIIEEAPQPQGVVTETLDNLEANILSSTFDLNFAAVNADGTNIKIFATAGQSQGKNFVSSEYRQIGVGDISAAASVSMWDEYVAKFGEPILGSKVFVKVVFVNPATGEASTQQSASTTVVSAA